MFSPDDLNDIKLAADLVGMSVSEFLRTVGVKKARTVIEKTGGEKRCASCGAPLTKHSKFKVASVAA